MSPEQKPDTTPETMTPREWLTLVLRAFGVWELLSTADQVVTVLDINAGLWKPIHTEMGSYITHALATFLIGIWLLRGAPTIARLFHPTKPTDS